MSEYTNTGRRPGAIPLDAKIEVIVAYNGVEQKDWRGPWLAKTTYWGFDRAISVLKARVV